MSTAEASGIHQFLHAQPNHPRYRYLLGAAAFAERQTYAPNTQATYNGASFESPNAQLSALLTTLNVRSITAELAGRPAFPAYQYALLAVAARCGSLTDLYPKSLRPAVDVELRDFTRSSAAADRRQLQAKGLRLLSGGSAYDSGASPIELTELRFLAESGLDVSTRHWTLALERGTYDFSAPGDVPSLGQSLFELLGRSDESIRGLGFYRAFDPGGAACRYLVRGSRQALEAWYGSQKSRTLPAREDPASVNGPPLLLMECVKCHSSDIAPPLPFADSSALTERLLGGRYPHGHLLDEILFRLTPAAGAESMPRGINISASERRELADYFITLAAEAGTR